MVLDVVFVASNVSFVNEETYCVVVVAVVGDMVVVIGLVVVVVVVGLVVGRVVVVAVTKDCLVYSSVSAPSVIYACAPTRNIVDNTANSAMMIAFFMVFIPLLYKWFVCRLRCAPTRH